MPRLGRSRPARAYLFLGRGGPQAVSGADTGSGADTATLAATLPAADTGSGLDTAVVAELIPAADTGSGLDTATALVSATGADTGSGADTATLAATLPAADTGSGADTATLAATIPAADTATGTDLAGVRVTGSDAGSGLDTASTLVAAIASDTGSGADTAVVTYPPFPQNVLGIKIELLLNGAWTDITAYVQARADIMITNGRPNEAQQATPAQMTLTVNNRGGTFTPQCTASLFYPYIVRNTQIRCSVTSASSDGTNYAGYRFWGEVSSWPPQWDPTGTDVYAAITASGILQRLTQGYNIGSALYRYYNGLPATAQLAAYWPLEDASGSSVISSGIAGGFAMSIGGTPGLAGDSNVPGSAPFLTLSGGTLTGDTNSFGSSGDDVYSVPGTYTWVAPPGITSPVINVVAGGGGGAAGTVSLTGGGGGGGGSAVSSGYTVVPGTGYTVIVGAGGAPGSAGVSSSFNGNLIATPGQGTTGKSGGAGGSGSGGTAHYAGGAGAAGGSGSASYQVFTSSGTWTAPAGTTSATAQPTGGGGGGEAGHTSSGGSGGGGGETSQDVDTVTEGTGYTVTVGAAGTAGASGSNGADGGPGGASSFTGNTKTITGHGGGGGAGAGGGAGGTGYTGLIHYPGGAGSATSGTGGGGAGAAGSTYGTGQSGQANSGGTGGAGGTGVGGAGSGGKGGNAGGGSGANGGTGGTPGGGGGGGGQWSGGGGAGGKGGNGQVIVYWSAAATSGGGGGGGSGGSAGAGNAGSSNSGGAAVTGGGPGGQGGLAASGASPVNGPGGGGGGGDLGGTYLGAAGSAGQVQILYTPPTSPSVNVLRFLLDVPATGGTDGAIVAQLLTGGTVAKLNVVYHTGGNLELLGYNSGGSNIFDSGSKAFSCNGQPMMVSAELTTSGSNVAWKLTAVLPLTLPGTATTVATWTGTVAGSVGNVSAAVLNPGGTEVTAVGTGHVAVQYAVTSLTALAPVMSGYNGELAGDRFLRLCGEESFTGRLVGDAWWSWEDGTVDGWTAAHGSLTPGYSAWSSAGLVSLLVTADGSGQPSASSPNEAIVVEPGDICSAYADVLAISAVNDLTIQITFLESDGVTVVATESGTATALTAGNQATLSLQGQTAPALSAYAAVTVLDAETPASGTKFAIDNTTIFANSQLGPQDNNLLTTVMNEIEDADQGLLFEPRDSFGLGYRTRKSLENQTAGLVADYSQATLGGGGAGLQPVWDAQLIRNDVIITRNGGAVLRVTQTTGPMSVQAPPNGVGGYNYQNTVYAFSDAQLTNLTAWIITKGTVNEGRYPLIPFNLARSAVAALFADIPGLFIGDYLQVINLPAFLPPGSINQLIYGVTEVLNAYVWTIAFNAVPEDPYASGSLPDW